MCFEVVWGLAYQGFDDVGKLLGNPICDGPPTGNNWSEGDACFVDFREAIELGGTALVGYSCLYLWVVRPPVCLMSLGRVMSLFLRWEVGSLGRTL